MVHHCPWRAGWPRAISTHKFCWLTEEHWFFMDGIYIPIMWGDCGQGDHSFESLPPNCIYQICWTLRGTVPLLSLKLVKISYPAKKICLGCQLLEYIVLGPQGVWHSSSSLNIAISLQKPTKSHRPSDNNCFTFLKLPVICGMNELCSWELFLRTIYWGLFLNNHIYYFFFFFKESLFTRFAKEHKGLS